MIDLRGLAYSPLGEHGLGWDTLRVQGPPPDLVVEATNQVLGDYLTAVPSRYVFGSSHPWTQRLQNHPHMEVLRDEIRQALVNYCRKISTETSGKTTGFDLRRDLSDYEIAKWLFSDAKSWATNGNMGTDRAFIFGSFRLDWRALGGITCENCVAKARIAFHASDTVRMGSNSRNPWDYDELFPDDPFGRGKPFNSIPIFWIWFEYLRENY